MKASDQGPASLKLAGLLLTVALLLPTLLSIAAESQSSWTATVVVKVPAVSDDLQSGRLIDVTVTVTYPGSGRIEVVSGGSVDPTTRTSMEMAVYAAALAAGIYWGSIDVSIKINSVGSVAGPSGSLAVAIATLVALSERSARSIEGYAITGAISPDTLSASVGGISVKCRVANEEGYVLVIPGTNVGDAGENCRFVAEPGLLSAMQLLGWPTVYASFRLTLPEEFNAEMLRIAREFRGESLKVLEEALTMLESEVADEARGQIEEFVARSESLEGVSPYAAASQAFAALARAYVYYYQGLLASEGVNGLAREISILERELAQLQAELEAMEPQGSIYYIEFLSTAYTRLADARGTLEEAKVLLREGRAEDAASNVGYAKARMYTIRGWVETAKALRGVGHEVSQDIMRLTALRASEYVGKAVEYAKSLAEYQIRVYDVPWKGSLRAYLVGIDGVIGRADAYLGEGNYVAAIGFYREAMARTLSLVFARGVAAAGDEAYRSYMAEMSRVYSMLSLRSLGMGIASGMGEAYRQYSEAISVYSRVDAVILMEQAVASSLIWSLAAIPGKPGEASAGLGGGLAPEQPVIEPVQVAAALTVATAVLALTAGLLAGLTLARPRGW